MQDFKTLQLVPHSFYDINGIHGVPQFYLIVVGRLIPIK